MSNLLAFLGLGAVLAALIALIKGDLRSLRIRTRKRGIGVLLAGIFCFLIGVSLAAEPTQDQAETRETPATVTSPSAAGISVEDPISTSSPSIGATEGLTQAQKRQVEMALLGSVTHYEDALAEANRILRTGQYDGAPEAIADYSDPTSPASRWRTFGRDNGPFNDFSYMEVAKQVESLYPNVDSMPAELAQWSTTMDSMATAWAEWYFTATQWQISNASTAQIAAAEKEVTDALARARSLVSRIVAAS